MGVISRMDVPNGAGERLPYTERKGVRTEQPRETYRLVRGPHAR